MADIGIIKFQLGGIQFCVYADQILEIVRYAGVRKIPKPLPYVVGLIELRHYIVSVVDFRKRVGLPPTMLSKDTIIIVAKISTGMIGVVVEAISDFKRIPADVFLPPISVAGFPEQLLSGVLAEEDDMMIIPNFDKIFSSYINVRLVPISQSEKLAFQYRFVPGSLTRTLERNLRNQYALDLATVRKLPHSLSLPSVRVHKVTSYYADFQPQQYAGEKKDQRRVAFQKLKAVDEQYVSLSQQFLLQQQQGSFEGRTGPERQGAKLDISDSLAPVSNAPISNRLEHLLHTLARSAPSESPLGSMGPFQLDTGKQIARTLQLSSVCVAKYLTYYAVLSSVVQTDSAPARIQLPNQVVQTLEERVQELLNSNRSPTGADGFPYVLWTLDALRDEGYILTHEHLEKICLYYQVTPIKMAKFTSYFEDYAVNLEPGPLAEPEMTTAAEQEIEPRKQERRDAQAVSLLPDFRALGLEPFPTSVSECIQYLEHQGKLSEDRSMRHVAAYTRVSTCRLSKLRSYYW